MAQKCTFKCKNTKTFTRKTLERYQQSKEQQKLKTKSAANKKKLKWLEEIIQQKKNVFKKCFLFF